MMEHLKRLVSSNRLVLIILLFVVSFLIRLTWTLYVQRPEDAIYSDMEGYITRAHELESGTQQRNWFSAVLPYGTHYLYALEMFLFGRENYVALAVVSAILGSVCVVCVTLASTYCFNSALAVRIVAILSCIWYPFISFNGFFSTEIPYSFFMYLGLIFLFRYLRTGKGALFTGLLHGTAFTIRPQIIMTFVLLVFWIIVRKKSIEKLKIRSLCIFVLPVVLVVGYSMYRYYHFTGEFGLISGNGPVTKLFGATEYKECVAFQTKDGVVVMRSGFGPPSSQDLGLTESFIFEGRIIDADTINKEIESYQSKLSLWKKLSLKLRNVSLLAYRNKMWPERVHADRTAWRRFVFEAWHVIVRFYWFPLVVIGFIALWFKKNPYLEVVGLHVLTMLYAAYAYIGEIRYRVPYDLLLMILAVLGVLTIYKAIQSTEFSGQNN